MWKSVGIFSVALSAICVLIYCVVYGIDEDSVRQIPDSEILAPLLDKIDGVEISETMRTMVSWPKKHDIDKQKMCKDRSHIIKPVYPDTDIKDPKPVKPGATSPDNARREAEDWIRKVLTKEFVPKNPDKHLVPLQRDPASQSLVVCRYWINGHAIQITQCKFAMWIVIKPAYDIIKDAKPSEIGPIVFKKFLTKGDRMATFHALPEKIQSTLHVYIRDMTKSTTPDDDMNWWGWQLWYTNGDAVAFFVRKTDINRPYMPAPDDPWF